MPNPLVRVYRNLAAAEQARTQLLASGFLADHVHLSARDDEAGPVEGNFIVGNGIGDERHRRGIGASLDSSSRFNNDIYEQDYQSQASGGNYVLLVDAEAEPDRQRACDIMDRLGAVDIEQRSAR